MNIFPKPIRQTKHFQERKQQRASNAELRRDFNYKNIKKIFRTKNNKGNEIIRVFTMYGREYRMVEKDNCFLILTIIKRGRVDTEKEIKKLEKKRGN